MLVLFAACDTNFSGTGNSFVVTGQVKSIGERSIRLESIVIESSNGKATNWFKKHDQFHNNYDSDCLCWDPRRYVGRVFDANGNPTDLQQLQVGQHMRLYGSVRSTQVGKTSEYRAVYNEARVLNPLQPVRRG
jgi:hypothetical protein